VARIDLLNEQGKTGLQQWSGMVQETYTPKLHWPDAYAVYDEMRRRDPGIRSMLNALMLLARTASWYFEPGGDRTDDDKRFTEHCEQCATDMSHTLEDAIEDALTSVWFGWAWQYVSYKRREGEGGRYSSQYDDGLIGWRKWSERRQSSFDHWDFDDDGGVQGMVQRPAPTYEEIEVPIEYSLHFRGMRDGTNPEGWALGESVYEPWYFCKNLHIISGIGWERSFVGLPTFEYEETPDADDPATVERVGKALVVGEKIWIAVPKGVKFHLETVRNDSAASLLEQIKYERRTMMQTLLADFLDLGTGQTGSWALGQDKSVLFLMAVDGILDRLAAVINRFEIRNRLMVYNRRYFPGLTGVPTLQHKKVEKPSLGPLGAWLQQVSAYLTWTELDETWLRQRAGMPSIDVAAAREEKQKRLPPALQPNPQDDGNPDQGDDQNPDDEMAEFAEQLDEKADAEIEAELEEALGSFLEEQRERIVTAGKRNERLADDTEFWANEGTLMAAALLPSLLGALSSFGERISSQVDLGIDWSTANPAAMRWLREYNFDLVTRLNDTTREEIREAMQMWMQAGGEKADLAKLLERSPAFGRIRARAIADTETTRMFSEASSAVAAQFDVTYAIKPPSRTNCRCRPVLMSLPDGSLVGVWLTANDDLVW